MQEVYFMSQVFKLCLFLHSSDNYLKSDQMFKCIPDTYPALNTYYKVVFYVASLIETLSMLSIVLQTYISI